MQIFNPNPNHVRVLVNTTTTTNPRNRYEHRAVAAPFPPSHTVQRMRQHPVFGVTESVARLSDRFSTTPMHGVHSKTNKTNEHSKRTGEKTVAAKQARRACLCHTRAT